MTPVLALAASDLRQRRLLLAASALLGLFALGAPLLPSLPAGQPGELRAATALLLLAVWTPLLALIAGATALAGEMADRRLGFYLARPLSTWKIWAGKMGAAVLLPLLAGALVVLPAALAGDFRATLSSDGAKGGWAVGLWLLTMLGLVLFAHAAAIALRSRRAWLLLDLGALAVAAVLVNRALWVFVRELVPDAAGAGASALAALVLAALLAAGAIAVDRGRGEPAGAHRALSLTLWPPVLAGALGLLLFARWVVDAPLGSVKEPRVWTPAGAGTWVTVSGRAAHRFGYQPRFLFDTASGRAVKTGVGWPSWPVFAADASHAVWLTQAKKFALSEVWTLDLAREDAHPQRSPIEFTGWPQWLELSPRGGRLAVLKKDRLLVFGVRGGRLLASAWRDPQATEQRLRFTTEGRLRLVEKHGGAQRAWIDVRDLALGGDLEPRRRIDVPNARVQWELSRAGDRLLVRQPPSALGGAVAMWLYALPAGELLASLPADRERVGAFLADGRVVMSERAGEGRALRLLARDGREERTFRFPGAKHLRLGGQPGADDLLVGAGVDDRWTAYRLDLRTGLIAELGRDLFPAANPETAGPAARLFRTADGSLVEIAEDGTRRVVLPPR